MCINLALEFDHIGMACFNIDDTASFYISLGYEKTETVYDPIQNVNICFMKSNNLNLPCIELIAPHDDKSPINKNLQKNGVSPYHICYKVNSLEETIEALKMDKFLMVSKPSNAVAFSGRRVSFLFNKNVGLVELVEK